MTTIANTKANRLEHFACFGSTVTIRAEGREPGLLVAVARARALSFEIQRRLSRFNADSELCRLNADPRERVPASLSMRRFAAAVAVAGEQSGGLVDATCLPAVEAAGYVTAVAPTGLQAEVIAKTAILAGPEHAAGVLVDGGVIVLAGGVVEIVPPAQNPGFTSTATSPRTRRNPHEHIAATSA